MASYYSLLTRSRAMQHNKSLFSINYITAVSHPLASQSRARLWRCATSLPTTVSRGALRFGFGTEHTSINTLFVQFTSMTKRMLRCYHAILPPLLRHTHISLNLDPLCVTRPRLGCSSLPVSLPVVSPWPRAESSNELFYEPCHLSHPSTRHVHHSSHVQIFPHHHVHRSASRTASPPGAKSSNPLSDIGRHTNTWLASSPRVLPKLWRVQKPHVYRPSNFSGVRCSA